MNRVELDVAAPSNELDVDDHQIVDVVQVFSDTLRRVPTIVAADDKIPRCPLGNVPSNMTRQSKLAVAPLDFHLYHRMSVNTLDT